MNTTAAETARSSWDADRDETFFRLVRDLFRPAFLQGASVLLASYDRDVEEHAPRIAAPVALPRLTPVA